MVTVLSFYLGPFFCINNWTKSSLIRELTYIFYYNNSMVAWIVWH